MACPPFDGPNVTDVCDEDHMDTFHCSSDCFMLHERGPQTQELWDAISMTSVYSLTLLGGVVGNLIVCMVIVRQTTMHTATNYYLFNLAVSDMVYMLFGAPFEIVVFWHQYPFLFGLVFCKFRTLITEACSYVSVLTIVVFSMERYLAICYPLASYAMSGLKRATRIIAAIWLTSLLSAIPFATVRGFKYIKYPPNSTESHDIEGSEICTTPEDPVGLYETSFIVFFVIPMVIISVLYVQMGIEIRSRSKLSTTKELGIRTNKMSIKHTKSRRAVIKMLAAVVICFFISWAPFHAQRIHYLYGKQWPNYEAINKLLFQISGFFYYFACNVNPIIYNMMSQRYRVAFKETLCGKRKHKLLTQKTTSEPVVTTSQVDPFDAETGTFSRTRSMRLSQHRMQRQASTTSRTSRSRTSFKESKEITIRESNETTTIKESYENPIKESNENPIKESNENLINESNENPIKQPNEQFIEEFNENFIKELNENPIMQTNENIITELNENTIIAEFKENAINESDEVTINESIKITVNNESNEFTIKETNEITIKDFKEDTINESNEPNETTIIT